MALRHYSSTFADTTLVGDITNSSLSLSVASASGAPTVPFPLVLGPGTASEEMVDVTAVAGSVLTVTRGVDGTTAVSHTNGTVIRHAHSARDFNEQSTHSNAITAVHGVAVTVVGTTDVQTLTNKTLTTPTIGSLVNATHAHTAGAGGGTLAQANTHGTPDTDAATSSLHHTIGTGATQATPGTHPALTSGTHGVTSLFVGINDTQTLANKTLTTPTIGSFVNATHAHTAAASGGTLSTTSLPAGAPRGQVGYTSIFTNRTSTGAESAACMSVIAAVVTGRLYRITASFRAQSSVANDTAEARVYSSESPGTAIDADAAQLGSTSGAGAKTLRPSGLFTTLADGSYTYTVVVVRTGGSGTVTAAPGNGTPTLIVEDVGAA